MIRATLTYVAAILITIWLIIVAPFWILVMAYVGKIRFLPNGPPDAGYWLLVAALYLPPIASAAIGFWLLKSKNRTTNA